MESLNNQNFFSPFTGRNILFQHGKTSFTSNEWPKNICVFTKSMCMGCTKYTSYGCYQYIEYLQLLIFPYMNIKISLSINFHFCIFTFANVFPWIARTFNSVWTFSWRHNDNAQYIKIPLYQWFWTVFYSQT